MKQNIAFFDFDGTITNKDSLIEFIHFYKGIIFCYLGFAIHLPFLLAMKIGLISPQRVKEMILTYFFKDEPIQKFDGKCLAFCKKRLPYLIRPKAMAAIRKHQDAGDEVVIVSASPRNWISPWSETIHIKVIATNLLIINNQVTGRIMGKNCNASEKPRRIKQEFKLEDYAEIFVYGDSAGDKAMMNLGTKTFYRPFHSE